MTGVSPILPIAATQPRGEATRLDKIRARLAADLRAKLLLADDDRGLGEALDRWELSLFSEEPFRSAQVSEALTCLLLGAVLLGPVTARADDDDTIDYRQHIMKTMEDVGEVATPAGQRITSILLLEDLAIVPLLCEAASASARVAPSASRPRNEAQAAAAPIGPKMPVGCQPLRWWWPGSRQASSAQAS